MQSAIGNVGIMHYNIRGRDGDLYVTAKNIYDPAAARAWTFSPCLEQELSVFGAGCAENNLLVVGGMDASTCLSKEASCTCLYGEDDLATTRTCEGRWWGDEGDSGLRWSSTQSVGQWEAVEVCI